MNSIVVKLGLSIVFLFLVVLFPLGHVINNVFSNFYYQQAYQDLSTQSERLVDMMTNDKDTDTPKIVANVMKLTDNSVFILDAAQHVVTQSDKEQNLDGMLSTKDWRSLQAGSTVTKRVSMSNTGFLLVGNPIISHDTFSGAILMLSSSEEIQSSIAQIRKFIALSSVGAIFLALGFTVIVVRKLSFPLLEMERATRRISKGDLQVRIERKSNDELGSLAEAINDLASALKRLQDTRTEFFVNISHELRTPLTYIEGYLQLMNEEMPENPEQRNQIFQIIIHETKRLKGLVNDLFDLSKLEEGKMALTLEWIDIIEVIDNAWDKVKLRAEKKGIRFDVQERDIPLMFLDGDRMQQIFINLLDNAIRYTEKGTITFKLEYHQQYLSIEVADTGIGIPQEELPFIFERFHRVEKSRSREYGGTGLGLAIVKKLVELQGGTIDVISYVGVGTTFKMMFPIPAEERSE